MNKDGHDPKKKIDKVSARLRLGLSAGAGLLFFLLFTVLGIALNRRSERQLIERFRQEQVLQTTAVRNAINENLRRLVNESSILATYSFNEYEQNLRSRSSMETLFAIELASYADVAAYVYNDYSGEAAVELSDNDVTGKTALSIARMWEIRFREHVTANETDPFIPPLLLINDMLFLGFLYPVRVEGEIRGSLSSVVDLRLPIERYVSPIAQDLSGIPLVLNREMKILWASDSEKNGMTIEELRPNAAEEEYSQLKTAISRKSSGFYIGKALNVAWSSLDLFDRSIIIALVNDDESLKTLIRNQSSQRLLLYLFLFIGLITIGLIVGKTRLSILQKQILEENRESLNRMVLQKTREIKELLDRYTTLFDSANDVILLIQDERIYESNRKASELFGYSRTQLQGMHIAELSPKQQRDGSSSREAMIREIKKSTQGIHPRFRWTHANANGKTFETEVSLNTIVKGDQVITQAILRDISEQIRAMEEKEVMIKEIHHRVKNNLQIIDSLLSLQSQQSLSQEASRAVMNTMRRVDAMAKLHEILYQQDNLSKISSKSYFNEILGFFMAGSSYEGKTVHLGRDIADYQLDPGQSMYAGIIISELVDNAIRHGSRNQGNAEVHVSFSYGGSSAQISVEDRGSGFKPDAHAQGEGLGLELISVLSRQLQGSIRWSFSRGSLCTFTFPIDEAISPSSSGKQDD